MVEERELHPQSELRLFGFAPTPAEVRVVRRPRSWRVTHAFVILLATFGLTPLAALVPPHVPWALAVLVGGLILVWRRWNERVTLLSARGTCPRCGAEQEIARPTRLRHPHTLSCPSCHQDLKLAVALQDEDPTDAAP